MTSSPTRIDAERLLKLQGVPPNASARAWVASTLGEGARVVRVRRLKGGISAAMHALDVETPRGEVTRLVLRRWVRDDLRAANESVGREARTLQLLEATTLPAPRLVAVDLEGEACGRPSILMTWLPGKVDLSPRDPDHWLDQMAGLLVRVHAADVDVPPFEPWYDPAALEVPRWTTRPALWRDAISLVRSEPPATERCFLHGDFQHFNLLWRRGELVSAVDWVQSSTGAPGVDVAHCALNLTLLYSPEHAERFLTLYERQSGRQLDPRWQVAGLLNYLPGWGSFLQLQAGRARTVDFLGMHARVETTLEAALRAR